MGCLRFKPGVRLDRLELGGAAILAALLQTVVHLSFDLVVTSGTDGEHSGPQDPHRLGRAIDVRTRNLSTAAKDSVLTLVMGYLAQLDGTVAPATPIVETSGGFACLHFFGFLEKMGTPGEHLHFQVRRGRQFPPPPPQPPMPNPVALEESVESHA